MTAVEKVQALLTAANAKTGQSDTNLTDAVAGLIEGYGGSSLPSGVEVHTRTFTSNTNVANGVTVTHGLGVAPHKVCMVLLNDVVVDGEITVIMGVAFDNVGGLSRGSSVIRTAIGEAGASTSTNNKITSSSATSISFKFNSGFFAAGSTYLIILSA